MKVPREKIKPILIMLGVLIVLALPLMFLLQDFVRDAIVTPLSYQVWLAGVILDAVPQSWFLAAGLAVMVLFAIGSLRANHARTRQQAPPRPDLEGRVATWYQRVEMVSRGAYSKDRFDQHFGQLLIRLVAHEERLSVREAIRLANSDQLEMPTDLQPYLEVALQPGFLGKQDRWSWLKALLKGKRQRPPSIRDVTAEIDPALTYIETQLKIAQPEEANEQPS